jgi:3-deoxy-manno-octulosonate cytidylyltransferase (CMP-KDO synthetase)
MKIIGIIPSRYASTRLPAKSLAEIHGKPMVQHVYERAQQSRLLTEVIVATDDTRIESAVNAFGGRAVMTPVDIQSGSDRIAYAARGLDADIIVNIQGDEPLIDPVMIDDTIRLLLDDASASAGTAVKIITSGDDAVNPNVVKVVLDAQMFALYFSRSPIPHVRDAGEAGAWPAQARMYKHLGLYVYRAEFLQTFSRLAPTPLERAEKLEQLRMLEYGYRIKCAITVTDSIAVDTFDDLEKVRLEITKRARSTV